MAEYKSVWYLVSMIAISLVSVWFRCVIFLKMTPVVPTKPTKSYLECFSGNFMSFSQPCKHQRASNNHRRGSFKWGQIFVIAAVVPLLPAVDYQLYACVFVLAAVV